MLLVLGPGVGQEDQCDQGGRPWGRVDQGDLEGGPGGVLCESATGVGPLRIVVEYYYLCSAKIDFAPWLASGHRPCATCDCLLC